ncbi:MAG TPA: sigma-70 family RNA polymerase sigma factor [Gemmatimonadaceae bacterium]|nr:sigma-70 family RNA polymerase sigma factor [Gemmatimonadaceae bacterium]
MPRLELVIDDETRDDAELTTLVAHARTGNATAFEELARRVRSRVRRWAGRLVRDGDDAEDVTQLVLLRLHARIGDYEGRSRFTSWLYRVTRNLALDHRRTVERRRALLAPEMSRARASIAPDVATAPDVAARDDDAARLARLVRAYFTELPPRQREVFEMADLHGRAPSEIAAALAFVIVARSARRDVAPVVPVITQPVRNTEPSRVASASVPSTQAAENAGGARAAESAPVATTKSVAAPSASRRPLEHAVQPRSLPAAQRVEPTPLAPRSVTHPLVVAEAQSLVSVTPPPGKRAAIMRTPDPAITVVWLY